MLPEMSGLYLRLRLLVQSWAEDTWSVLHLETLPACLSACLLARRGIAPSRLRDRLLSPDPAAAEIETAVALWQLLLAPRYRGLEAWFRFLQEHEHRAVSRVSKGLA